MSRSGAIQFRLAGEEAVGWEGRTTRGVGHDAREAEVAQDGSFAVVDEHI